MKFLKISLLLSLLYCQNLWADFKVGDIILLDLDCWSCQMIEDETNGPYSHSGIILKVNGKLVVAQSLTNVHHLEISTFLSFSNNDALLIRPKYIDNEKRRYLSKRYLNYYYKMPFDHDYLWDDEKLYCSEFIYKLLDDAGTLKTFSTKPMNFKKNWDYWYNYYNGNVPQNQEGMSPNDFWRSQDFKVIKTL